MKSRRIYEIIFYYGIILLIILTFNFAVKDLSNMDISYLKLILLSIPITVAAMLIVYFPIIIPVVVMLLGGYAGYLAIYEMEVLVGYYWKVSDFIYWLQGYIIGYEAFDLKYTILFSIVYAAFTAIIISLLTISKKGSFIQIVLGTAAHSFFWFMYVGRAKLYLFIFLFASILLYTYKVYKKKSGEWLKTGSIAESDIGRKWVAYSSVIIIMSLLSAYFMPFNIKPVRWEWLNNKVIDIFPFVLDWRNDALDSYSYGFHSRFSSGFQGSRSSRLGGPILLDESIMLNVSTSSKEAIYLRGVVKDVYTGYSWEKKPKSFFQHRSGDMLSLPFDTNEVETYTKKLMITPKKLISSTIFAPYKLYRVNHKDNRFFVDEDSEAYFSKQVTRKESYEIECVTPYINEEKLRAVSTKSDAGTTYFQLNSNLPDRVKRLAYEITSKYDNDYDKIKAVESYLRTNYKYTLEPSRVPSDYDFVDYFLFEGKEGYCTYFATAMAVMLRASNIPCRYVEGFLSVYPGNTSRDVKGSFAHAWVEVNFEKYGWITFEATPAYSRVELVDNQQVAQAEAENNDEQTDIALPSSNFFTGRDMSVGMEDEGISAGTVQSEKFRFNFNISQTLKYALTALVILRILFLLSVKTINEIIIKNASGKRYAKRYLKNVLECFGKMGYKLQQNQTLREYSVLVHNYIEECASDLDEVIALLEKTIYSERELQHNEKQLLERYRKNVRRQTFRRLGLLRYCWGEYVLGR
ncbi:MAG: transglutaminase-like domain-containing protein [Bacillota bacterium]